MTPVISPDVPASGIGSWPGTDPREAVRAVRDLLVDGIPHLPELPARGLGAEMIGRGAAMLPGLHVETQPYGWRFVDRAGRDEGRAAAFLRQDLDELAEAYDGWSGPLKVQVAGPWTLLSGVELPRGELAVSDPGARRDVVAATAEGLAAHVADVARLVPGATVVVQVDEPALPAVLDGRLPTQSGYGRLRAVGRQEVREGIATVLTAAGERVTLVHCCAADVPVELLVDAGARGVACDLAQVGDRGWDEIGAAVESGTRLWAGALPTGEAPDSRRAVSRLVERWRRLGLVRSSLRDVVVTPACGLAAATPRDAVGMLRAGVAVADELADVAAE